MKLIKLFLGARFDDITASTCSNVSNLLKWEYISALFLAARGEYIKLCAVLSSRNKFVPESQKSWLPINNMSPWIHLHVETGVRASSEKVLPAFKTERCFLLSIGWMDVSHIHCRGRVGWGGGVDRVKICSFLTKFHFPRSNVAGTKHVAVRSIKCIHHTWRKPLVLKYHNLDYLLHLTFSECLTCMHSIKC